MSEGPDPAAIREAFDALDTARRELGRAVGAKLDHQNRGNNRLRAALGVLAQQHPNYKGQRTSPMSARQMAEYAAEALSLTPKEDRDE